MPQCSAVSGDKVKDLFDNCVICALEGKEERQSANGTSSTSTSSDPPQRKPDASLSSAEKGKQKATSDDEEESSSPSIEDRATRPGLSMEEDGTAWPC